MNKLLDIAYIKKNTPDLDKLKVTLKKDPKKGNSLFASKPIKKGAVIAYYKMLVYDLNKKDTGPFGNMYFFTVYTKKKNEMNGVVGNLYEGSVPPPFRNIPYWAYFSNEPSGTQTANCEITINTEGNYRNRNRIKVGETIVYKLIASKNIPAGDELVWCYGSEYERHSYVPNC